MPEDGQREPGPGSGGTAHREPPGAGQARQNAGGERPSGDGQDHVGTPRPDGLIPALNEGQLAAFDVRRMVGRASRCTKPSRSRACRVCASSRHDSGRHTTAADTTPDVSGERGQGQDPLSQCDSGASTRPWRLHPCACPPPGQMVRATRRHQHGKTGTIVSKPLTADWPAGS